MQLTAKTRQKLCHAATEAMTRAYAPYSRIQVGAAVLTETGQVFSGGNVENASYGLTLCAERVAIAAAVAVEGPQMRLRAIAVASNRPGPFAPCGACRQVVFEFGPEALVIFPGEAGFLEIPVTDLLPYAFRIQK
uniref:Cytidine deaminase n=1 Tax=Desulfobacca acetoxidans TaxID=60893 RepID=A0A7C3ZB85_9BACT